MRFFSVRYRTETAAAGINIALMRCVPRLVVLLAFSIGAGSIPAAAVAAASVYDQSAAAIRTEYRKRVAECRKPSTASRASCVKLARIHAQAALEKTYEAAMAGAKAEYAGATAKCRQIKRTEHRHCMKSATAEHRMALGRAEEIRSAPLAMGP